jgi:hypothetical protein
MVVAKYLAESTTSHRRYLQGRRKFPIPEPPKPLTLPNYLFEELQLQCPPHPKRFKAAQKLWLSPTTMKRLDTRCALRRNKNYDKALCRRLTRQITKAIYKDCKARTEQAGKAVKAALNAAFNQKKANDILKRWYRHFGDRHPKPSRQDLNTTAREFQDLYQECAPVGDPIPGTMPRCTF